MLESLRPPQGYQLDHAIGTTFSLDLMALLAAPLAFSLFDWEDDDGRPTAEPHALLAAVREHAARLSIFCQASQIAIPPQNQLLYGYLEDSVHQVRAPHAAGVFHPKIWLLRYEAEGQPVRYRFLCLSRNLTFDRAWDVALVLDGELTARRNAYSENHPLGDFVAALPELALEPLPEGAAEANEQMQQEVRRVDFELPDGFDAITYWPLGITRRSAWPFDGRIDRLLSISPFLSPGTLRQLTGEGQGHLLVSRLESLAPLEAEELTDFAEVHVLSDSAEPEPDETPVAVPAVSGSDPSADTELAGLHAKAYVADAGWRARLWVGSANATEAAFERNVEFLVELEGQKSFCGIDACLGAPDGTVALASMLTRYEAPEEPTVLDVVANRLEHAVNGLRRELATAGLAAHASAEADGRYELQLMAAGDGSLSALPSGAVLKVWPATQRPAGAVATDDPVLAVFPGIALESVTPFFAFEVTVSEEGQSATARFVLKLPLSGAPEDRHDAILRRLLSSRSDVVRYLLMLLAASGGDEAGALSALTRVGSLDSDADGSDSWLQVPLLESLLAALDRDPAKLAQVQQLIDDLSRTEEGRELLPKDLTEIWAPIRDAARAASA